MISQAPRYIQTGPPSRQNAHINSQLIKNNSQAPIPHRGTAVSPQPILHGQAVSFRPIEMINNGPIQYRGMMGGQPIQQMGMPTGLGLADRLISVPNPANLVKVQPVNRSNSSSRLAIQHERVEYLNVSGPSFDNLNQNRNSVTTMQQQGQSVHNKVGHYPQPNGRPLSNVSNTSSQSRNSIESRPINSVPLSIQQSKSVDQRNVFMQPGYQNRNVVSPARLAPSQPPANVVYMPHPYPQPQPQPQRPAQLSMHTSDVKVVYQRGSFSPNEHSSNEASRNQPQSPRNPQPANITANKGSKISIADLKEKKGEPEKIKSTAVESIIVQQTNPQLAPKSANIHIQEAGSSSEQVKGSGKESVYREEAVKQAESRSASSQPLEQPKKVYKSYDEYLQDTRKPEKIIQEIEQSQLATQINIQYKVVEPKPKPKPVQKQVEKEKEEGKPKTGYVYESVPIPTVYGYVDLGREDKSNSNQSYEGSYGQAVLGSYDGPQAGKQSTPSAPLQQINPIRQAAPLATVSSWSPQPQGQPQPMGPWTQVEQVGQSNNTKMDNISAIREQSQEYEHECEYEYSSSLIGSSLQDNLRQASSANREISDYEPPSWSKLRPDLDRLESQQVYTSALSAHNKINPFAMIQQSQHKAPDPVVKPSSPAPEPCRAQTYTTPLAAMESKQTTEQVGHLKIQQKEPSGEYRQPTPPPPPKWSYYNEQSNQQLISTKDKIASEKTIQATHRMGSRQQGGSQQAITSRHPHAHRHHIENEEEWGGEASFDIYELIDEVYNRELQTGLSKIRQVFGRVMAGAYGAHLD